MTVPSQPESQVPPVTRLAPPPVAEVLARIRGTARIGSVGGVTELTFQAMGTQCRVSFAGTAPTGLVADAVLGWIATFEARYSRFLPTSWISQINTHAGGSWIALDPEASQLLGLCGQLVFLSRGLLDPSALPLVRIWDWKSARIPSDAEIAEARSRVGWKQVQIAPGRIRLPLVGMAIDLGGVGKEFAVDQVILLLASLGVRSALVDFGADIRVLGLPIDGRPAWKIGLEDPKAPGQPWNHLILREGAVATSGDYLRGFNQGGKRFGHILDPRTGRPVDNGVLAASVMAPSCTQAGMLSTALFVLGAEEGRRLLAATPGVEGCILTSQGIVTSPRFYEHVSQAV